jgi:hypothetical protein
MWYAGGRPQAVVFDSSGPKRIEAEGGEDNGVTALGSGIPLAHEQPALWGSEDSVSDQSNELDRLRSEVAALKLELATLTSAIRELQHPQSGHRLSVPAKAIAHHEAHRPSLVPAAVVVLLASGLLSWQVMTGPRGQRVNAHARTAPVAAPATTERAEMQKPQSDDPAEPALTPALLPPIYKGALTVRADSPGATVFVNRLKVGTAPVRVNNLRAGAHLVWVENDGYRRWTRVVTVPAETVTRVDADLEPAIQP